MHLSLRAFVGVLRDKMVDKWQGRFKHGFAFAGFVMFLNKFDNGAKKFVFTVCQLASPATTHWPISLFDMSIISGPRKCWHVHVCGITYGTIWLPNVTIDGELVGPDYRKHYVFFSCINHYEESLEEIAINAQ